MIPCNYNDNTTRFLFTVSLIPTMFIFWGFEQRAHIQKILSSSDTDVERKKHCCNIVLCLSAILVYAPNHILTLPAMWYQRTIVSFVSVQFRLRIKTLQNRFLHELCHFSASVNSILPPKRYMFNILSFLMSVACTCMHTHTHISFKDHVEVFLLTVKMSFFKKVNIQQQIMANTIYCQSKKIYTSHK